MSTIRLHESGGNEKDLLFHRHVLGGGSVKFVFEHDLCGLATGLQRHFRDVEHFVAAFVGFLKSIFAPHLHRHTGNSGIAFVRRFRPVQFRSVGLASRSGHGQFVAGDFVRPGNCVVGKGLEFEIRHEPEMACDPAGPLATRVASPLPVTGAPLVLLLSLNSNVNVFPSGETVDFEVATVLPFFLSVSSISWPLMGFTAMLS